MNIWSYRWAWIWRQTGGRIKKITRLRTALVWIFFETTKKKKKKLKSTQVAIFLSSARPWRDALWWRELCTTSHHINTARRKQSVCIYDCIDHHTACFFFFFFLHTLVYRSSLISTYQHSCNPYFLYLAFFFFFLLPQRHSEKSLLSEAFFLQMRVLGWLKMQFLRLVIF